MEEHDGVRGKRILQLILNIAIPLAGWGFLFLAGPKLLVFFMPFVIGAVIALIAHPLVSFLERHLKLIRRHSSMVIVVLALGAIVGLFYLVIVKTIQALRGMIAVLPEAYENFRLELQANAAHIGEQLPFLPQDLQNSYQRLTEHLGDGLGFLMEKIAPPTVEAAGSVAKGIPGALVYSVVTILSAYFFIVYRERLLSWLRKHMPEGSKRYLVYMKSQLRLLVGGYFLAQFKIMAVVWVILTAGLLVLGTGYAPLKAVLIAFLDFLPIFGTGTVLIPWGILKVMAGEYYMALGLLLLYILTQVVRQLIQPKLVGDSMGLNPFWTLLFLYLGFKVSGIAGMILAVPVGLLLLNLYRFGAFDPMFESVKALIREINQFRKE